MTQQVVEHTLSADVATSGTFTISYPSNTDSGHYLDAAGHTMEVMGSNLSAPGDFTLTFGTSNITVTYLGSTTIPSGTKAYIGIEMLGQDFGDAPLADVNRAVEAVLAVIRLGAPDALDVDGVAAAQAVGGAGNLTLNGALVSGGVATFDVPRAVEVDSSNAGDTTQTATVTGTDEYGVAMTEDIAFNGTTAVAGQKAFKTVTQVAIDAALAGNATCGTTDVLGLPLALADTGFVLAELENNQAATAGTVVAADGSAATATTNDVRGTYDPNSACDGSKAFTLICALPDPSYKGVTQA